MHNAAIPQMLQPLLEAYLNILEPVQDHIYGVYVCGSTALGAFEELTSDIDVVILTHRKWSATELDSFAAAHRSLRKEEPLARRLEVAYMPLEALGKSRQEVAPYPHFQNGVFNPARYGDQNAVTWWILQHKAIALLGPDHATLPLAVDWSQIVDAMSYNLNTYWAGLARHRPFLYLDDESVMFAVTTLCRILTTLEDGEIIAKSPALQRWRKRLPASWHRLLDEAWRLRHQSRAAFPLPLTAVPYADHTGLYQICAQTRQSHPSICLIGGGIRWFVVSIDKMCVRRCPYPWVNGYGHRSTVDYLEGAVHILQQDLRVLNMHQHIGMMRVVRVHELQRDRDAGCRRTRQLRHLVALHLILVATRQFNDLNIAVEIQDDKVAGDGHHRLVPHEGIDLKRARIAIAPIVVGGGRAWQHKLPGRYQEQHEDHTQTQRYQPVPGWSPLLHALARLLRPGRRQHFVCTPCLCLSRAAWYPGLIYQGEYMPERRVARGSMVVV
ncbi:nucleotidyltransferase domain-containing protein [Dictyobacter aurantiacus]|uniref:nucleotidyltransferase domain-containing protein n=1 Tax=Dictyobacter aurantiacus TaxID=1936993 RepID=UPI000F8388F3|nr:nucleotidyltransferase domain-containing protein [Dictyobacter aurantiacus]